MAWSTSLESATILLTVLIDTPLPSERGGGGDVARVTGSANFVAMLMAVFGRPSPGGRPAAPACP